MFYPLFPVSPAPLRPYNVHLLGSFIATLTEENDPLLGDGVVDPIAWSPIDPKLSNAFANGPAVIKVAILKSEKSGGDPCLRFDVPKAPYPFGKEVMPVGRLIMDERIHESSAGHL
jgi:hypothetical protein